MIIQTHYYGPGMFGRRQYDGSCIFATCKRKGQRTRQKRVPYDYALSMDENHKAAACALFRKLEPQVVLITKCDVLLYEPPLRITEVLGHTKTETTP
jgi:hypothetical protein